MSVTIEIKCEDLKTKYGQYEKVYYDDGTIRYYRLEPSENFNDPNMDGALVRRRMSKATWDLILKETGKQKL